MPPSTSFIGRKTELQFTLDQLRSPNCRLLTILGMGGIGKTRLALEASQQLKQHFSNGVHLIDLDAIDRADLIIPAIAQKLDIHLPIPQDATEHLTQFFNNKQTLLVFDNFEHVLEGSTLLSDILQGAPGVKILVTTREALRLVEEQTLSLSGIGETENAVALFTERAQQTRHNFEVDYDAIAEICACVDGVPLAIELAAAWAKILSATEILEEIRYCLDFLATDLRNVPEKHQSIRAVFQSTWQRLDPLEQQTMMRLSVFRGGCTPEAAKTVARANLAMISSLRDKSLISVTADGRYQLHNLIQQYILEDLQSHPIEHQNTEEAHSRHYANLIERETERLKGSAQKQSLQIIGQELQNVKAGWHWAKQHLEPEILEQYLPGMMLYYQMQSRTLEAIDALTFDEENFAQLPTDSQGRFNLMLGWLYVLVGRNTEGIQASWSGIASLGGNFPEWLGLALVPATNHPEILGDQYTELQALLERVLAQSHGNAWQRAWLLKAVGEIHLVAHRYPQARDYLDRSAAHFRQIGDRWGESWACGSLGLTVYRLGEYKNAEECYRVNLNICEQIGDYAGIIDTQHKLASALLAQRKFTECEKALISGFEDAITYNVHPTNFTYLLDMYAQLRSKQDELHEAYEVYAILHKSDVVQIGWRSTEVKALANCIEQLRNQLGNSPSLSIVDVIQKAKDIIATHATGEQNIGSNTSLIEPLTNREIEILILLSSGHTNREIAEHLTIAIGTVKTHVHNIYGKLGAANRADAVTRAHDLNLV